MVICFNGCSFTVGEGFPQESRDNFIYDRLVCDYLRVTRKNIARSGSSNLLIFQRTANEICYANSDIIINQWSALNRLWLSPGPEHMISINDKIDTTFFYQKNFDFSEKQLRQFKQFLRLANHDYQNIIDLCLYTEVLNQLAAYHNKKIFHINGLIPWCKDLEKEYSQDNLKNTVSRYTKYILDYEHLDKKSFVSLFENLRQHFQKIDNSKWINLFDSWYHNQKDLGPEGHHPGPKSHKWMAKKVISFLKTKNIL